MLFQCTHAHVHAHTTQTRTTQTRSTCVLCACTHEETELADIMKVYFLHFLHPLLVFVVWIREIRAWVVELCCGYIANASCHKNMPTTTGLEMLEGPYTWRFLCTWPFHRVPIHTPVSVYSPFTLNSLANPRSLVLGVGMEGGRGLHPYIMPAEAAITIIDDDGKEILSFIIQHKVWMMWKSIKMCVLA